MFYTVLEDNDAHWQQAGNEEIIVSYERFITRNTAINGTKQPNRGKSSNSHACYTHAFEMALLCTEM